MDCATTIYYRWEMTKPFEPAGGPGPCTWLYNTPSHETSHYIWLSAMSLGHLWEWQRSTDPKLKGLLQHQQSLRHARDFWWDLKTSINYLTFKHFFIDLSFLSISMKIKFINVIPLHFSMNVDQTSLPSRKLHLCFHFWEVAVEEEKWRDAVISKK